MKSSAVFKQEIWFIVEKFRTGKLNGWTVNGWTAGTNIHVDLTDSEKTDLVILTQKLRDKETSPNKWSCSCISHISGLNTLLAYLSTRGRKKNWSLLPSALLHKCARPMDGLLYEECRLVKSNASNALPCLHLTYKYAKKNFIDDLSWQIAKIWSDVF